MKTEFGDWSSLRRLAGDTFSSSFHFAMASVNSDGTPHVTPIGSLLLGEPGHAVYFEVFTRHLAQNLEEGSRISILGVNSSRRLWVAALISGRFGTPPAFRLSGTAGRRRESSAAERVRLQKKLRYFSRLQGYRELWSNLSYVRELELSQFHPVELGRATRHFSWQQFAIEASAAGNDAT